MSPPKITRIPRFWATRAILGTERSATAGTMAIWVAFPATRGHSINQAQATAEEHTWIHCPTAANIRIRVSSSCFCRKLCRCQGDGPTLEAMLVPEGHTTTRTIQIRVACTAWNRSRASPGERNNIQSRGARQRERNQCQQLVGFLTCL